MPARPLSFLSAVVLLLTGLLPLARAESKVDPSSAREDPKTGLLWYDVRRLGLEGQGWKETKAPFDRLPAKAEKTVRPAVWGLSRHSAGMCVRFRTDATAIQARWVLTSGRLAMPHMPATGVSGLDLYVQTAPGKWHWLAVGRPAGRTTTVQLVAGLPPGERTYLLYLPLYNGVSSVEVGIDRKASLSRLPRPEGDKGKALVFYGTSITQGGCASRPGMVHTAILGRRLGRPVINLGFSGNGRMEPELARLMAELDPAVYVLDCLPNMTAKDVKERVEPFVKILRAARPTTPILLVEDRTFADAFLVKGHRVGNTNNRVELKAAFERLQKAGVKGLHYLPGDRLLGADGEGTVDGSHPTDLGFWRQAGAFEEALRKILGG
jgi:hypothetical protein